MKDCVPLSLALPWGWDLPVQNLEDRFPPLDVMGLTVSTPWLQEKVSSCGETLVDFCESGSLSVRESG